MFNNDNDLQLESENVRLGRNVKKPTVLKRGGIDSRFMNTYSVFWLAAS